MIAYLGTCKKLYEQVDFLCSFVIFNMKKYVYFNVNNDRLPAFFEYVETGI